MATPSPAKMKAAVKKIFNRKIPSVEIVRIDAKPMVDSDGEDSLRIKIVVNRHPPRKEAERMIEVIDQFRTWLVQQGDERFPYFRLRSEAEEQGTSQRKYLNDRI